MSDKLGVFAKGAVLAFVGLFLSKFLAYVYRAIVARSLGPEAYGVLSLALTVAMFGISLSKLALNDAIEKFVPELREKNWRGVVISSLQLGIPTSIVIGIAMILSAEFIATQIFSSRDLIPLIYVLAITPFANVIERFYCSALLCFEKVKYEVIANQVIQNVSQVLVTILLISSLGIVGAALGWVAGAFSAAIAAFYFMEFKTERILLKKDSTSKFSKKVLLKYSSPLIASVMVGTVLNNIDNALLGIILADEASIGIYNAAYPTAMLLMIPGTALGKMALPSFSEMKEKNRSEFKSLYKSVNRWKITMTIPAFTLMCLFPSQIINILFGASYTSGSTALIFLSIGFTAANILGQSGDALKAYSETRSIFGIDSIRVISNVGLNVALIPLYGIEGAAIATSATFVFAALLSASIIYKKEKIHPFSFTQVKPFVASGVAVLITYVLLQAFFTTVPKWAVVPGGLLFGAIYLSALVILRGYEQEDISLLRAGGQKYGFEKLGTKIADALEKNL